MKKLSITSNVLVTDVDPGSTNVMSEMIQAFFPTLRITQANTSSEAMAFLRDNDCQVIVSGFSGNIKYDALSIMWRARQFNPDVIIIIMSGFSQIDCGRQINFQALGVNYFWKKPFKIENVQQTFEEIFRDEELENLIALAGSREEAVYR